MLEIHDLHKTYSAGIKALDGIDLMIGPGMFGLLGPNGAGKSTLMRTIASLQLPDSGQIVFDGTDVLSEPMALRQRLGYLPQYFGAYPYIGCRALLRHMAILKGLPDTRQTNEQIDELLELTNLTKHASRSVTKFSGGMRQRFGIAQALLGDPDLLILDEPTAGLDPEERLRLYNLLSQLSTDRVVLLSTHIVDDVEQLCPLVAIIHGGRIACQGATQDLLSSLEGKIWSAPEGEGAAKAETTLSTSFRMGKAVSRYYSDENPGAGFTARRPTLQDLYFRVLSAGDAQ